MANLTLAIDESLLQRAREAATWTLGDGPLQSGGANH